MDAYFTNTPHYLGGANLSRIEADSRYHHDRAFFDPTGGGALPSVGRHRLRSGEGAEEHLYSPEVIHTLQQAVWNDDRALFDRYAAMVEEDGPRTIRSLLTFRYECCKAVPLEKVEPAESIVRRFKTGAMSYGSISREAHECMALAMNHLGGKSNSGEGGELPERFGTARNSAIKQVASGRFGVTRDYLLSAKEIQIKMAQGAKPGEGGHLPGAKVTEDVAKTRCSTPGVSLISPPPHHDIYSIEDLAELIYDLQCANEAARVTVKLVSSGGVGTIASGVAKAGAKGILISGGEGGTGAAPVSSIHHAGLPWEIGLAEAHQVLCRNDLRQCVTLETDGKLMSGHDVAVALLLGAEEFGFATRAARRHGLPHDARLPSGHLSLRHCHAESPVAQALRWQARIRGALHALYRWTTARDHGAAGRAHGGRTRGPRRPAQGEGGRAHRSFRAARLFPHSEIARGCAYDLHLENRADKRGQRALSTADRAFGTTLKDEADIEVHGCGGQAFGAFLRQGQKITLRGEANDYLGKGLSGGTLAVCPPEGARWSDGDALIGNVALYGATSGAAYIAGAAGERFCVRNSGAAAVAEGVGDHGCEYMTGGRAAILGPVGDNFAAGMSGGVAYVLDEGDTLARRIHAGALEIGPVTGAWAEELKGMLQAHARLTGSPKAASLLSRWKKRCRRSKWSSPQNTSARWEEGNTWARRRVFWNTPAWRSPSARRRSG